ncbi:ATP phosphoribosyltransferase regulatory subunit [Alphaproteobacteria bacterium GH1-50]|uniref:ATP phosphoribosyltransferase regulatory subunit n=1 Tax=Kangsaoukella pontilimi TaxID=2691042 RepID=A0A7C9ITF2_9RHOB|nr:ATP phosphoribosyltransferase regulatory subunit [Kangsaoukella pontilimi]MXQ09626.1 ATP phosphoribosyltransferase regulatory subunit [Kangsaoukella pontilimi]
MTAKSDIRAEADRLRAAFEARGAEPVEADILQPAGALLDLYGEDIRARAFVTHDPIRGEMMLRPDFTVPLVSRHMAEGRGQARYTYAGEVFRRQEDDPERASEYLQVGYELFNGMDAAEADAEVFATFATLLEPLGLRAEMGDIGLLRAAVAGLNTSDARKAALLHHLWRPRRFKALIERYAGSGVADARRAALLDADEPFDGAKAEIGLRSREEILSRIAALRAERETEPLGAADVAGVDALLAVSGPAPEALSTLQALCDRLPSIIGAVDDLARRMDALDARGVALDRVRFETSHGRTMLEYYDGFVFGFYAEDRPELPPVATGGRYDALTRAMGGGTGIPAVGGAIRPGLILLLGGRP